MFPGLLVEGKLDAADAFPFVQHDPLHDAESLIQGSSFHFTESIQMLRIA